MRRVYPGYHQKSEPTQAGTAFHGLVVLLLKTLSISQYEG